MTPAKKNFEVYQGKDFTKSFQWKTKVNGVLTPVDITGYHIKWEIIPQNSNATKITWQDEGADPVFTVDTVNNKFVLELPNAITTALNFINAFHELTIISSSGKIYPMLKGEIKLVKDL